MSTLTRDPFRAAGQGGRWDWPDPAEVTPPAQPMRRRIAPAPEQWPAMPPPGSWPPAPGGRDPAEAPVPLSVNALEEPVAVSVPFRGPINLDPLPEIPAPQVPGLRFDPSPSRAAYRMHRLWLTPAFRHFVRVGLPVLLVALVLIAWFARAENRAALAGWVEGLVQTVQTQPMFMVHSMQVVSRTPEVAQAVAAALPLSFPVSSFDLDLPALRAQAEDFEAVQSAWFQVRPGGVLEVTLQERVPALVWRHSAGLDLIDASGHRVAMLATREARADLPLIAGEGAPAAAAEARLLWAAATPLHDRIRGFVRMGARRWDLVLDRDQRILLPEHGALGALERVLALDAAQDLLSRDLRIIDLRNPARPTLRLSPEALTELHRNRPSLSGAASQ